MPLKSQKIVKDGDIYFGEDDQPEMFAPEIIEHIEFHDFSDYKRKAEHFKKTLLCFPPETEPNLFFSSVVYTLSYLQKNKKPKDFLTAIKTIGEEKFLKLKEIEKNIMLDLPSLVFLKSARH